MIISKEEILLNSLFPAKAGRGRGGTGVNYPGFFTPKV